MKDLPKKRIVRIVVLLLLLAVVVLCFVAVRYVRFSTSGSSQYIREFIGIPDPPELVAQQWMQACQNGDAKKIAGLLSQDRLDQLLNRAAINDPPLSMERILNEYAESQKKDLKDASFEIEKDPFFPYQERRLRYSIRVIYPDKSVKVIRLLLEKDSDGDCWKYAGLVP